MISIKPTKKMIDGLKWFRIKEPVAWFPCDGTAPSHIIRRRLKTIGWVEECGKEPVRGFFSVTQFRVSELGLQVLAEHSQSSHE
jgi:hypothetical protein